MCPMIITVLFALVACSETPVPDARTGPDSKKADISADAPQKTAARRVALAQGYERRVMAAVRKVSKVQLSERAVERIVANRGSVMVDSLGTVAGIPQTTEVSGLFDQPDIKAALLGSDEEAAADLLYNKGVRTVIVHYSVARSTDVGKRVLSRIYHHDHLKRFQLIRVGEDVFIYRVRKHAVQFDAKLAAASIRYIRDRLMGGTAATIADVRSETGHWTFVATVRAQGRELAVAFAQDANLPAALEELVRDLERLHRRRTEYYGFPPLKDHIKDLRIEIQRVTERAYIEPRDDKFLAQFWELGIDGVYMITADKKNRAVLPGSVSFTRSLNRPDTFLREAAKVGRMPSKRPWREENSWFEMFRTIHYVELPDNRMTQLTRGFKTVPISAVTLDSVRDGIIGAAEWYLSNLQPDGSVVYKFWPEANRYANENNIVRHALSTWNLVQAYEVEPRPEFIEAAKATLGFTEKHRVEETNPVHGEMAFYRYKDNVKLGTVVIGILGIVDLARATGSDEYDALLVKLGNFTKFMAQENGRFLGYYVPKTHPYHGKSNDIVPGEAALALVYLAEYFDDDSWLEPLEAYWSYYMPLFRERASKKREDAPWPWFTYENDMRLALVQMSPWTVMAANAYHERTGDEKIAEFGLEVGEWMIDTYQWSSERAPWPDYVGGYFKLREELPAMQAFCYAEGTAAAYQLAVRMAPKRSGYFEKSTREAMRLALAMQYTEMDTYAFSRPLQVMGGIRYALNETKVRIDYVHHALSSMYLYYKGAASDPNLPAAVRNPRQRVEQPSSVDVE